MPKELAVRTRRRGKHLAPGSSSMGVTELAVEVQFKTAEFSSFTGNLSETYLCF